MHQDGDTTLSLEQSSSLGQYVMLWDGPGEDSPTGADPFRPCPLTPASPAVKLSEHLRPLCLMLLCMSVKGRLVLGLRNMKLDSS